MLEQGVCQFLSIGIGPANFLFHVLLSAVCLDLLLEFHTERTIRPGYDVGRIPPAVVSAYLTMISIFCFGTSNQGLATWGFPVEKGEELTIS